MRLFAVRGRKRICKKEENWSTFWKISSWPLIDKLPIVSRWGKLQSLSYKEIQSSQNHGGRRWCEIRTIMKSESVGAEGAEFCKSKVFEAHCHPQWASWVNLLGHSFPAGQPGFFPSKRVVSSTTFHSSGGMEEKTKCCLFEASFIFFLPSKNYESLMYSPL